MLRRNLLGSLFETMKCAPPLRGPRAGYFPNVVLTSHENERARFYDDLLRGKTVIVNFMYTTCEGRCPLYTSNLLKVQRLLGDRAGREVHMYSFTLDPVVDTPRVLRNYADAQGVGPGWRFFTGKPEDMELLRRKLGFTENNPELDRQKSFHTGLIRYGNEQLDRWAACPALADPAKIVRHLSWLDIKPCEEVVA
ncbi:MAG: SCO family protein [Acidobacteria bacterium]|nr:SCO family protein [Acidobacteriota bacterium]